MTRRGATDRSPGRTCSGAWGRVTRGGKNSTKGQDYDKSHCASPRKVMEWQQLGVAAPENIEWQEVPR